MMGFVKKIFSNYSNFKGRARRSEYWLWCLFNYVIFFVATILYMATGSIAMYMATASVVVSLFSKILALLAMIIFVLSIVYLLATIIPTIAVTVRRLHDTGKSGVLVLLHLIPVIGSIVFLVFMLLDSTPGDNQYGPNPKGIKRMYYKYQYENEKGEF